MQTVTFITGNQGSGKTTLATNLAAENSNRYIVGGILKKSDLIDLIRSALIDEAETLVIDDFIPSIDYDNLIFSNSINMRLPYTLKIKEYKMPKLIITTQVSKEVLNDYLVINKIQNFEIVEVQERF